MYPYGNKISTVIDSGSPASYIYPDVVRKLSVLQDRGDMFQRHKHHQQVKVWVTFLLL